MTSDGAAMSAFHRTLACFRRRVKITIPQLSPTHTKAKIYKWCIPVGSTANDDNGKGQQPSQQPSQQQQQQTQDDVVKVECYDPLFILQCSPDVITEGYRKYDTHEPLFIVEAHDEGMVRLRTDMQLHDNHTWYDIGDEIGEILDDEQEEEEMNDDGDGDTDDKEQWLWQAYSYEEEEEEEGK